MALSNIFREPRREITESGVGIFAFVGVLGCGTWLDYRFGCWLEAYIGPGYWQMPWQFGMFAGLLGAAILVGVIKITHSLGEAICDDIEKAGIQLRPRNRR